MNMAETKLTDFKWIVTATDDTINKTAYAPDAMWVFKNEEDALLCISRLDSNGNYSDISYKKYDRIFIEGDN